MCSFDICSLFTCVPILETIDICADMLYWSYLTPPDIPEVVFVELMKFATTSIEFSFDNIMYRQVDGIFMGVALGSTMAGIFVGFYEVDSFSKYKAPKVYFCYVDNTFCVFGSETEAGEFFSHLNNMNPALRFTLEKENNSTLPFLFVLVCKETSAFQIAVHRKPTFTGLYICCGSFCPKKQKINQIKTLTHWVLMICSKLDNEIDFITGTLCNNGFPEEIVQSVIRDKFLTSVKLNLIQSRGALYISGCLGLVILLIDLPIRSLLVYVSAIFLPTCVWFSARGLF